MLVFSAVTGPVMGQVRILAGLEHSQMDSFLHAVCVDSRF